MRLENHIHTLMMLLFFFSLAILVPVQTMRAAHVDLNADMDAGAQFANLFETTDGEMRRSTRQSQGTPLAKGRGIASKASAKAAGYRKGDLSPKTAISPPSRNKTLGAATATSRSRTGTRRLTPGAPLPGKPPDDEISMLFWTWNSAKVDLEEEARSLFRGKNADVLVTCQQEATTDIGSLDPDGDKKAHWLRIATVVNAGFTSAGFNKQILNVFLRQPTTSPKLNKVKVSSLAPMEYARNYYLPGQAVLSAAGHTLGAKATWVETQVPGVADVYSIARRLDAKGKGGATVVINWLATANRKAFETTIHCAHLDDKSDSVRFNNIKTFVLGTKDVTTSELTAALDASDFTFFVGDLNYRFRLNTLRDLLPEKVGSHYPVGNDMRLANALLYNRSRFMISDPLSGMGDYTAELVADFGFKCNDPSNDPPTYKLQKQQQNQSGCKDLRDAAAVIFCYAHPGEKDSSDELGKFRMWRTKGDDYLSIGWLDRTCTRISKNTTIQARFGRTVPWKDNLASDHMAVSSTVQLSGLAKIM